MTSQSTGTPPEYTLLSYSKMEKNKIVTCFNVNFKVPRFGEKGECVLGFSTMGMKGSFFRSCRMERAARFLDSFLLLPSPSAENSPTLTQVRKLFMCGGPLSFKTWGDRAGTGTLEEEALGAVEDNGGDWWGEERLFCDERWMDKP
ncbi:hypothetical protein EYF80_000867 [Liparis tanakae]|uniref:Uncharacterized protein n=1 Tax=Liparis tanakae TaxID=230148 RepID=A0A4Z2JFF2_9TELE|nr:hypothetical protein EYF80_000867 [Liparis tanakae]